MDYIPFNNNSYLKPLHFPLLEENLDSEQPVYLSDDEDPYKLMEEFYSTFPSSWFQEADTLLYGASKDCNRMTVGDLSAPDVPESSVSSELYSGIDDRHSPTPIVPSNTDVGYSPMRVPELIVSPEPSCYSNINVGYPPMPGIPKLIVSQDRQPLQYRDINVAYPPLLVPELIAFPDKQIFHYSEIDVGYSPLPVPELTVPPEPIDYSLNQGYYYSTDLKPVPYMVQQGYVDTSMRYEASYIGYPALQSYSTNGELVESNSQIYTHIDHMEFGMSNFDVLSGNVMRRSQELEFPPAFGSDRHTVGNTSGYYSPSEPPLYPTYDESIPGLSTTFSSSLPYLSPGVKTSSQSFPATPETLNYSLSSSSSPSFPATPDNVRYPSPIAMAPERGPPVATAPPPSKKGGRKPRENVLIPPVQRKPPRKFPNGRSPVRSQAWIDRCATGGICKLCPTVRGTSKYRPERVLNHLTLTHFFQAVKNMEHFDDTEVRTAGCFIGTKEQFEYTRKYFNALRCSLCPEDTLLNLDKAKHAYHLGEHHSDVTGWRLEKEKERFKKLCEVSENGVFYNAHDQFLYGYPGGASSTLW